MKKLLIFVAKVLFVTISLLIGSIVWLWTADKRGFRSGARWLNSKTNWAVKLGLY